MDVKYRTHIKRIALGIGVIFLVFFALSSFYYKKPVYDPVVMWHGANLSVLSLIEGDESTWSKLNYDKERFKQLSDEAGSGDNESFSRIITRDSTALRSSDFQVKNQISANRVRDERLKNEVDRLEETSEQLLKSKKTIEGINQNFSSATAYIQADLVRQQTIQEALDYDREVPSEADANELMVLRSRASNSSNSGIPEKVLDNVQQTTGISPEEINKLMNQ